MNPAAVAVVIFRFYKSCPPKSIARKLINMTRPYFFEKCLDPASSKIVKAVVVHIPPTAIPSKTPATETAQTKSVPF